MIIFRRQLSLILMKLKMSNDRFKMVASVQRVAGSQFSKFEIKKTHFPLVKINNLF